MMMMMPLHCKTIVDNFFTIFRLYLYLYLCIFVFVPKSLNWWWIHAIQWPHPPSDNLLCFLCIFLTDQPCKDRLILPLFLNIKHIKRAPLNVHLCIWVCNFVSVYLNLLKRFILMPTCGQPRKQLATRCVCTVIFWLYSEYTASHSTMRCGKIIPHYTYCTFCFTFFYSKIVKPCTTFFCACTLNTFFQILLYPTFYIHLCTNIALQIYDKRNTLWKLCSAFFCSTFY